jgi:uncharacterized protein (TIGR02001 family)
MKNLMKMALGSISLIGLFAAAPAAYAQDAAAAAPPAPDWVLSGYVGVLSDYRFRGISQDSKEATPQLGVTLTGPDGFYISTWEAKVNWGGNDPSYEADFYAGKHTDLDGTDLNIEAYYYSYPDANFPGTTASYYETIGQLTHVFGPLTLIVTGANSPEWSLGGGVGWYAEGTASWAVADWLSISGNVGHQWVHAAPSDYTHYDIGATATWKSWSLDVRYVGDDIGKVACAGYWMPTPNACSGGAVVTLNYNIANLLN